MTPARAPVIQPRQAVQKNGATSDNWFLDIFYVSRRDSRSFVPKRGCDEMAGATVNFARPAGLLLFVGIFAFLGLMYWLTRR